LKIIGFEVRPGEGVAPIPHPREDEAVSGPTSKTYVVTVGKAGVPQSIELSFNGHGAWTAKTGGRDMAMQLHDVSAEGVVQITVDGHPMTVRVVQEPDGGVHIEQMKTQRRDPVRVRSAGEVVLEAAAKPGEAVPSPVLRAPITGVILSVHVSQGDAVYQGERLLVLEAMKMETLLMATSAGVVTNVLVKPGDQVRTDQVLLELAAAG
jgi:biotin carboxyl carrier protein